MYDREKVNYQFFLFLIAFCLTKLRTNRQFKKFLFHYHQCSGSIFQDFAKDKSTNKNLFKFYTITLSHILLACLHRHIQQPTAQSIKLCKQPPCKYVSRFCLHNRVLLQKSRLLLYKKQVLLAQRRVEQKSLSHLTSYYSHITGKYA